jgi:hypothetical protein
LGQRRLAVRWIEYGHDVLPPTNGADRETTADDLSEDGQISVDSPQGLRAIKPKPKCDYFVKDQQGANLRCQFPTRR